MMNSYTMSFTMLKYFKSKSVDFSKIISLRYFSNALTITNAHELSKDEEIDKKDMNQIMTEKECLLKETNEDLSDFTPFIKPTLNLAPLVNKSETLSNLVKLGVDLFRVEKKYGVMETILKLDFENDVKKYLLFLSDYMEPDQFGKFLTKNPVIFNESIDDLVTRINYLESKSFSQTMIKRIITGNPFWLNFSTKRIDRRLGYFQKEFKLEGKEVRKLATAQPRLITYNLDHVMSNTFTIREEMGFDKIQEKYLLLNKPKLWMIGNKHLLERFDYVHNTMKISHEIICKMPEILFSRDYRIKQRHSFLEKLGRAQYDLTKPNYVSLIMLIEGTDAEFCTNVARCPVADFNLYLKSL